MTGGISKMAMGGEVMWTSMVGMKVEMKMTER
jgi:hypothetical protein